MNALMKSNPLEGVKVVGYFATLSVFRYVFVCLADTLDPRGESGVE